MIFKADANGHMIFYLSFLSGTELQYSKEVHEYASQNIKLCLLSVFFFIILVRSIENQCLLVSFSPNLGGKYDSSPYKHVIEAGRWILWYDSCFD